MRPPALGKNFIAEFISRDTSERRGQNNSDVKREALTTQLGISDSASDECESIGAICVKDMARKEEECLSRLHTCFHLLCNTGMLSLNDVLGIQGTAKAFKGLFNKFQSFRFLHIEGILNSYSETMKKEKFVRLKSNEQEQREYDEKKEKNLQAAVEKFGLPSELLTEDYYYHETPFATNGSINPPPYRPHTEEEKATIMYCEDDGILLSYSEKEQMLREENRQMLLEANDTWEEEDEEGHERPKCLDVIVEKQISEFYKQYAEESEILESWYHGYRRGTTSLNCMIEKEPLAHLSGTTLLCISEVEVSSVHKDFQPTMCVYIDLHGKVTGTEGAVFELEFVDEEHSEDDCSLWSAENDAFEREGIIMAKACLHRQTYLCNAYVRCQCEERPAAMSFIRYLQERFSPGNIITVDSIWLNNIGKNHGFEVDEDMKVLTHTDDFTYDERTGALRKRGILSS